MEKQKLNHGSLKMTKLSNMVQNDEKLSEMVVNGQKDPSWSKTE